MSSSATTSVVHATFESPLGNITIRNLRKVIKSFEDLPNSVITVGSITDPITNLFVYITQKEVKGEYDVRAIINSLVERIATYLTVDLGCQSKHIGLSPTAYAGFLGNAYGKPNFQNDTQINKDDVLKNMLHALIRNSYNVSLNNTQTVYDNDTAYFSNSYQNGVLSKSFSIKTNTYEIDYSNDVYNVQGLQQPTVKDNVKKYFSLITPTSKIRVNITCGLKIDFELTEIHDLFKSFGDNNLLLKFFDELPLDIKTSYENVFAELVKNSLQ